MSRRPGPAVATGLLSLAVLAGASACGTGQGAQTYKKHSYDYVNADLGAVAIRDLAVDGPTDGTGLIPAGGTATVSGTLVSTSEDSDTLTGASSPAAATAVVKAGGAGGAAGSGASPSTSTSASASPSSSASPAGSGAGGSAGGAGSVQVPPLGRAEGWTIELQGLTAPLRAGSYIDLTLVFAKAGRTTLHIPVRSTSAYSGAADASSQPRASETPSGPLTAGEPTAATDGATPTPVPSAS